jgi:imidazoleglycerol phosphate dehydratase HisB
LARQISGNSTIEVSYLPENLDDLNADGKITTEDLGIAVSYIQTRRSTDYNFIQSFAESLMGVDKNLTPSVLPGEKVNR